MYRSLSADRSWTPRQFESLLRAHRASGATFRCAKRASRPTCQTGFHSLSHVSASTAPADSTSVPSQNPFSCFVVPGDPKAWKPVNKLNLSTGENGEFGVERHSMGTLHGSTKRHSSH